MSLFSRSLLLCILVIAASVAVTANILRVPLFEVGEIWMDSAVKMYEQLMHGLVSVVDIYSPLFYAALAVAIFLGYHLYGLLFRPMDNVRILEDLGYLPNGKFSMKEIANGVRKRRVVGDIPPVYPNGWFCLVESWKLKAGEVLNLSALGEELAVFRDEKGTAHVLNAYCPHLGANLAVGGRVTGDCLECPFHGWKFRGHDGKCVDIPSAEKIPDQARVKAWPCLELNGWVHLWYHAEGAEPYWTPPEMEEITNSTWQYSGRSEHYINTHIQDIPENGADIAHLPQVHKPSIAAGPNLTTMWNKLFSFAWHSWAASWSPESEEHIGTLSLTHTMVIFGFKLLFVNVRARQIGPGIVYMMFESSFGKGVFIHCVTPVEPMVQRLVHNLYIHWTVPNVVAKIFLLAETIQFERDVMIWNNKKCDNKNLLVKCAADSLIARHRRWYSQFYSEHSPRLSFRKDTLDW